MAFANLNRPKAFFFALSLVTVGVACSNSERTPDKSGVLTPPIPTPAPTPVPTPTPAPTPTPVPAVSSDGLRMEVSQFQRNFKCKRGVHPTGTDDLRVGCSVEVRAEVKDALGNDVKPRKTGENLVWGIPEGRANITLPWDENPWKRWMTGVAPGHYRIVATLDMPSGEKIRSELEGEIVN